MVVVKIKEVVLCVNEMLEIRDGVESVLWFVVNLVLSFYYNM